jgi:TetR/AcrR family transcriptional repressor of nem operon
MISVISFRLDPLAMRYAADHKRQTRDRIVDAAARGFRAHGVDGLGVAALMSELGLTHGGFYAHFPDKESLVCAACERAFAEGWAAFDRQPGVTPQDTLRRIARSYLAPARRASHADGCLIAALGPELSRGAPAVRRMASALVDGRLSKLAARMPGRTPRRRRDAATLLISVLVGTMVVSRLLPEEEGRRSLRVTARLIEQAAGARQAIRSRRTRS